MSDEGEKTCPLCAEEMDLTDQQLRPCKCGYEICVWCWHHIMEMAEKDETDGRCPACRMPYDKEKIVGTAANCERLVAEINMEKKQKFQKSKTKTLESRKQLTSVRVIQKNLVYIVGLPLNLADEDLLQHKEYFAQYGKVLKVSISRTSAGTIQQFANNTCSVYITYSKEEEAVRCIQSVHGFMLDGRPLRACFGTTKYCHAWLRNVPCTNHDCLYLHEIGSQEDSFTKDEIISAYSRSRVQQITGVSNNVQRRLGNVLPPPVDDYCNNSSAVIGKTVLKTSSNNSVNGLKGSPPTSSSGRSAALPAAASWGARAPNCNAHAGSLVCSNGPSKHKVDVINGPPLLSTTVSSGSQTSVVLSEGDKKPISNEETHVWQNNSELGMLDIDKQHVRQNSYTDSLSVSCTPSVAPAVVSSSRSSCPPLADRDSGDGSVLLSSTLSDDEQLYSHGEDKDESLMADEKIQPLCSDLSSISVDNQPSDECSDNIRSNGFGLDNFQSTGSQGLQWHDPGKLQEHSTSVAATLTSGGVDSVRASIDVSDWRSDVGNTGAHNLTSETEDDFESQRLSDAIVVSQATIPPSSSLNLLNHLRGPFLQQHVDATGVVTLSPPVASRLPDERLSINLSGSSVASNGFVDNFVSHVSGLGNNGSLLNVGQGNHTGRFEGWLTNVDSQPVLDMGESNIISNILDLDLWDESLTSQNLAKLLGENDKQGPTKLTSCGKGQNSNQSRFSFARQEDARNQLFDYEPSLSNAGPVGKNQSFGQASVESRDPFMDRLSNGFGCPQRNSEQSENLMSGISVFPTTSRSQISAPPGFAGPCRPPPPGFTSHDRCDQTFDLKSGNHLLDTSAFLRNPYQASPSGNISSSNDIEFIDPAILAVGKGRLPSAVNNPGIRSNFNVQTPAFENESRLHLLMQRSLSHQNLRYTDVRDNFSPSNDAYGFSSRHMEQSQSSNISPFSQYSLQQGRNTVLSNGHWNSWNEIPAANDMGMTDLLRNDRLGFNKLGMPNSGDLYNRSFRM